MKSWKTCLFDLDGTLIDTVDDLASACEQVLAEFGFGKADGTAVYTRADYHRFVGNGIKKLVERALDVHAMPEVLEKACARFMVIYNENCKVKTCPYEGIIPLLDELKARGITMGIVTNKPEKQARYLAEAFFSAYDLRCVYGGVEGRPHKPDPTSLNMAMADCDADRATTLFIGDSDVDVETAHNGGLTCAGAVWGFRGKEELHRAGAEILLDHPLDLLRFL